MRAATLTALPTVPVEGLALIFGIDRFMSEARSLTNLVGNSVATLVVARWENALDMKQLQNELNSGPKGCSSSREPLSVEIGGTYQ